MLSKNLVRYRKRAKMTQKDVAEKLHISPQAYARYERTDDNRNEPNSENLSIIADLFDVSVDQLLGRSSKEYTYDFSQWDALQFKDKEGFDDLSEDEKQELWDQLNDQLEFLIERKKKSKDK